MNTKWFNLSNTKQLMHLYCFLIVIGRFTIKIEQRKSKGWGRFGGGWNWVLGIQVGSTSLILNLIILSIRISYIKPKKEVPQQKREPGFNPCD